MNINRLAATAALLSPLSFASPALAESPIEYEIEDVSVALLGNTTPSVAPGEGTWIALSFTSGTEAETFHVNATADNGVTVSYPTNTADHSSLYWDDTLSVSEVDYSALYLDVPAAATGTIEIDVVVTYQSRGLDMTQHYTVIAPIAD